MHLTYDALKQLTEALGDYAPPLRTFLVDMHDAQGNDTYHEIIIAVPPSFSDTDIVGGIFELFELQGFTIDGVAELLDGYTDAKLTALFEIDSEAAAKHIRTLYFNPECLPEVLKNYPEQVERIKKQKRGRREQK